MIKKLLPIAGVVFIAVVMAARTGWDEKLMEKVDPMLMAAGKIKATLNSPS